LYIIPNRGGDLIRDENHINFGFSCGFCYELRGDKYSGQIHFSYIVCADDADQYLPSLRQAQSQIEYLICTRINAEETSEHFSSPLIGFRVTELPSLLITLSMNGEPTLLPLTSITMLRKEELSTATSIKDDNDSQASIIVEFVTR